MRQSVRNLARSGVSPTAEGTVKIVDFWKAFCDSQERQGDELKTFVSKETPTATKIQIIRSGVLARVVDDMVAYLDVPKNDLQCAPHAESTAHKLIKETVCLMPRHPSELSGWPTSRECGSNVWWTGARADGCRAQT